MDDGFVVGVVLGGVVGSTWENDMVGGGWSSASSTAEAGAITGPLEWWEAAVSRTRPNVFRSDSSWLIMSFPSTAAHPRAFSFLDGHEGMCSARTLSRDTACEWFLASPARWPPTLTLARFPIISGLETASKLEEQKAHGVDFTSVIQSEVGRLVYVAKSYNLSSIQTKPQN